MPAPLPRAPIDTMAVQQIIMQVWLDCSGINSDMYGLNGLGAALKLVISADVERRLYYTFDPDQTSIGFVHRRTTIHARSGAICRKATSHWRCMASLVRMSHLQSKSHWETWHTFHP